MDWIGNVFCLGETGTPENPGPLILAGIDPGNCPACESAANKTGVAAPQQRFSVNVIKYKVQGPRIQPVRPGFPDFRRDPHLGVHRPHPRPAA